MGEFIHDIIQEYTQSTSVQEAKFENGVTSHADSMLSKNGLMAFVSRDALDKIAKGSVETKAYDVPSDFSHKELVKNSKRAFFRTTVDGAVDMAIHTSGDATVLVFQLFDHGGRRTKVLNFSAKNRELEEGKCLLDNEQFQQLADKKLCSGEFTYLVSVWLDQVCRQEEQGDLITFRIGPHIDRMQHALGGIWVAGELSPKPTKPASLIWYVPSQHVDSLIVNIDSLDDESEVAKSLQQFGTDFGNASGVLGIAVSAAALGAAAGSVGGPAGSAAGAASAATGAFVYAFVTFLLSTGVSTIGSLIEIISAYKEDIKKAVLKAAHKDPLNLSYGAYSNGVKLTLHFEDGLLSSNPDYTAEPWNSDIMEGNPGQLGAFLPADNNMSRFGLTFQIIENQKKQDD